MGLDDMFADFISECRDYIKEREYSGEIVEKAETIFDLMNCYIVEEWNFSMEFPENLKIYREIHKISLKMRIDMKEKLLGEFDDREPNEAFIKVLEEDREKLKQLEEFEAEEEV